MKEKISNNIQIKNKRATFDYELLDTFTAGIVLTGTEIKSIRLGKASLVDTFCIVEKGELWVKNMYIAEYFYGTYIAKERVARIASLIRLVDLQRDSLTAGLLGLREQRGGRVNLLRWQFLYDGLRGGAC